MEVRLLLRAHFDAGARSERRRWRRRVRWLLASVHFNQRRVLRSVRSRLTEHVWLYFLASRRRCSLPSERWCRSRRGQSRRGRRQSERRQRWRAGAAGGVVAAVGTSWRSVLRTSALVRPPTLWRYRVGRKEAVLFVDSFCVHIVATGPPLSSLASTNVQFLTGAAAAGRACSRTKHTALRPAKQQNTTRTSQPAPHPHSSSGAAEFASRSQLKHPSISILLRVSVLCGKLSLAALTDSAIRLQDWLNKSSCY